MSIISKVMELQDKIIQQFDTKHSYNDTIIEQLNTQKSLIEESSSKIISKLVSESDELYNRLKPPIFTPNSHLNSSQNISKGSNSKMPSLFGGMESESSTNFNKGGRKFIICSNIVIVFSRKDNAANKSGSGNLLFKVNICICYFQYKII